MNISRSDLLEMMEPLYEKGAPNDCWNWKGRITNNGYGEFWVGRWFIPNRVHAHRLMFGIQYGAIPKHLQACHKCDNRRCVNPAHVFIGTHLDNAQDRVRKGRSADRTGIPNTKNRGSGNGNSKLTPVDVREIRAMLADGMTQTQIAQRFSVCQAGISKIKRGESYL